MHKENIHDKIEQVQDEVDNLKYFVEDASNKENGEENEDQDLLEEELRTLGKKVLTKRHILLIYASI